MVTLESLNTKIDTMSEQITALITLIYTVRTELLAKIDEVDRKAEERVDSLAEITERGFSRVENRLDRLEGRVFA